MPKQFAIERYVEQKNRWNKIFGGDTLSLLSASDRKKIAEELECDLSPENLYCDGEISAARARTKLNFLERCVSELEALDPSITVYC